MLQEVSWKREHQRLQEQADNINQLKKEIAKEIEVDLPIQASIADKIETLKNEAIAMTKRLEDEKLKNHELQKIIAHIRHQMNQSKINESRQVDDQGSTSLDVLEAKCRKLEYDLSQMNGRNNRISESINENRLKINQTRTERVIDSGIFRNIEKELADSELQFKKLLIQKVKHQKEYEKLLNDYNYAKAKAQPHRSGKETSGKTKHGIETPLAIAEATAQQKKFTQLNLTGKGNRFGLTGKMGENKEEKDYVLKKIMIETGLGTLEELAYYLANIDRINEESFAQMNNFADQINRTEKEISEISLIMRDNKLKFYEKQPELTKNQKKFLKSIELRDKIKEIQSDTENEITEFLQFFNNKNVVSLLADCNDSPLQFSKMDLLNLDQVESVLQKIERKISSLLAQPISGSSQQVTTREMRLQKLQDMMSRVIRLDECDKIMKRSDFQKEYQKLVSGSLPKNIVKSKKKSIVKL